MNGVVMLVNEFPPLPIGGAERQAERLSQYLAGHAWNIRVLTRGSKDLPSIQNKDGFQILRINPFGPGKLKSLTFVMGAILMLWQERNNYQILHAHLAFGPAFVAAMVGRILKKIVIVKFGNSGPFGDIQTSQKTFRGRLRLAMLRRWVDVAITLDSKMQSEVLGAGFSKTQIRRMPNGIDIHSLQTRPTKSSARMSLGLSDNLTVVYTGRLSKQKSLHTLIMAICTISKELPNLQLVLVGDGPERHNLEELTSNLDLQNKIHFTGSHSDVLPYLAAADIFVLPSLAEGISNSLLEAMACGLACIATNVGGTPEVLGQSGILVDPDQPDQIAQALSLLAHNQAKIEELGNLAKKRILDEYEFEIVGKRYSQLYIELLNNQSPQEASV
jgi:glycosyltransferase involved in cell wall biosynthesis